MPRGVITYLYGHGGAGKSTLAMTTKGPRLLFDAEYKADALANGGNMCLFNPSTGKLPEKMDTDTTLVVNVKSVGDITTTLNWITSGKLKVSSVILDSITELQNITVDDLFKGSPMRQNDWGTLLLALKPTINRLMRLTKDTTNTIESLIITSWAKDFIWHAGKDDSEERVKPLLDGKLYSILDHMADLVGYVDIVNSKQRLQVEKTSDVVAKCNYSGLKKYGKYITNPSMIKLLEEIKEKA